MENSNKKGSLFVVSGIIALVGICIKLASWGVGFWAGKSAVKTVLSKETSMEEVLRKAADETNKSLPMSVDSETRLDNVTGFGNEFRYNYTLINRSSADIEPGQIEAQMGSMIRNKACSTPDLEVFFKNGISVSYVYYGYDGKQLGVVLVTPEECRNL